VTCGATLIPTEATFQMVIDQRAGFDESPGLQSSAGSVVAGGIKKVHTVLVASC